MVKIFTNGLAFWLGGVTVLYTYIYSIYGTIPIDILIELAEWPLFCLKYWVS